MRISLSLFHVNVLMFNIARSKSYQADCFYYYCNPQSLFKLIYPSCNHICIDYWMKNKLIEVYGNILFITVEGGDNSSRERCIKVVYILLFLHIYFLKRDCVNVC